MTMGASCPVPPERATMALKPPGLVARYAPPTESAPLRATTQVQIIPGQHDHAGGKQHHRPGVAYRLQHAGVVHIAHQNAHAAIDHKPEPVRRGRRGDAAHAFEQDDSQHGSGHGPAGQVKVVKQSAADQPYHKQQDNSSHRRVLGLSPRSGRQRAAGGGHIRIDLGFKLLCVGKAAFVAQAVHKIQAQGPAVEVGAVFQ